jgi:hypothetical protein
VRLASADGRRRLNGRRPRLKPGLSLLVLALGAAGVTSACGRGSAARNVAIEWSLSPARAVVGSTRLELRIHDASGQPVRGARLRVEAHMSHPGMAPVLAPATERGDGIYDAPLQFTMAGDWILLVTGTLSNGDSVEHRIDVPGVRPS